VLREDLGIDTFRLDGLLMDELALGTIHAKTILGKAGTGILQVHFGQFLYGLVLGDEAST
jgi:hypothetical protein